MREEALRRVLLVKAVEDGDREGALIPAADRAAAAREARRAQPGETAAEPLLARRAELLFEGLATRHPFVRRVLALTRFPGWVLAVAMAAGVFAGVGISALDGSRHIDILGPAFTGVVAWNFIVYAWIAWRATAASRRGSPGWLPTLASSGVRLQLDRLVSRSREFNAPLARALAAFAADWAAASRPLLAAGAATALHAGAAALGAGLVAGLYTRGMTLEYLAGWSSTFLDAARVHAIASVVYAPASWLTGVTIPGVGEIESMRWRPDGGGQNAARWIHLMAGTVVLFVIVPRIVLALVSHLRAAHLARRATLPAGLETYHRIAFGEAGGDIGRGVAAVMPYACEPDAKALAALREILPEALGPHLAVDARAPIAYGEEELAMGRLDDGAAAVVDAVILLFTAASTPEDENHGVFIAGVRDWLARSRPRAPLLVIVDAGPYAERLGPAKDRLAERLASWTAFCAARAVACCTLDLRDPGTDAPAALRRALERTPAAR